jgi:hypothetical protein
MALALLIKALTVTCKRTYLGIILRFKITSRKLITNGMVYYEFVSLWILLPLYS